MPDQQPLPDDELTQRLRQAARRRRPWSVLSYLSTLLLIGLPAALFAWWFWPRPDPPQLVVVAFDEIIKPNTALTIRATTELEEPSTERWGGRELVVVEIGQDAKPVKIRTDAQAIAKGKWTLRTPGPVAELEVRYLDDSTRPPWHSWSRLRVFTWPRETKLIAMDVEPTLKESVDKPAMTTALTKAQRAGWQLVYLAVKADAPLSYRKLRDWVVEQQALPKDALPLGPVMARPKVFDSESEEKARKNALAALHTEFAGPVLYLTADNGLNLRTVASGGDFAGDPVPFSQWNDLIAALPKSP